MKKFLLLTFIAVALFANTACSNPKRVYLNSEGEEIPVHVVEGRKDHTILVEEVCIGGVVYYYRSFGHSMSYSPKIIQNREDGRGFYETC